MNLYHFKITYSTVLFTLIFFTQIATAQINAHLPTDTMQANTPAEKDLKKASLALFPSSYIAQYAGSIGIISLGAGWDYGRNNKWATDVLMGYVPKYDTERIKITFTLRQTYSPFSLALRDGLTYQPLRTGMYVNTTFGRQFWLSAPDKYPGNYYSFSTKIRFNIFVGQNFTYTFNSKSSFFEGVKFYYDLHTSDLYLISRVQNKYLKFDDYLGLALGVKLQIRRQ